MKAFADTQINGRAFRVSTGVNLRECSVVIIGSTCKICGRDFKCESDVSLHTRWRHNGTIGTLINTLDAICYENIGQKCDICDMYFETISNLRFHKRLIHKHRPGYRKRRRKDTVRVIFKFNGATTTDVNLDRKYLKVQSDFSYSVNADMQTPDSLEKEKRQDNCAANIDLSLPDHVVDNSHIQYGIRPHKAANRYIVGKFASTKGDAIARSTVMVGRSLVEISNTPNKDVILGNDDSCEEHGNRYDLTSQENTTDIFIKSFADNVNIHDKENSRRMNERERKNIYCQSEISLDIPGASLVYQRDKCDKTASPMSKQNAWSNENHYCSIKRPNEVSGNRESLGLTDSLINSVKVAIDNKNSYNFDGATTLHLPTPLTRFNGKAGSLKTNSSIDDDIQEVLRITRGNAQNDINHESPNRTEREILIQNAIRETFTLPTQREPEKRSAEFTANFQSSNEPPFTTVAPSSYQFLTNAFNKKMGFHLENLHRYGIRYYNDLSEINNNNLEECEVHAHQDFFETWMQAVEPQYTSGLKANDNEAVVID